MKAISDLYDGDKRYNETRFINDTYSRTSFDIDRCREKLEKNLSKENQKRLEEIFSNFTTLEYEYGREMFITGFSLGVQLTAEGFSKKF